MEGLVWGLVGMREFCKNLKLCYVHITADSMKDMLSRVQMQC